VRNKQAKPEDNNKSLILAETAKLETDDKITEDDKSFISNVSTNVSDRLKSFEEEPASSKDSKSEVLRQSSSLSETTLTSKDEPRLLFELSLENGSSPETFKFFEVKFIF